MNTNTGCDKCFQPVVPENDATLVASIATGNPYLVLARPRHFLPTENCQGSPSRAQYIEGQPKDQRGYLYDKKLESSYRAAYELVRLRYAEGGINEESFNTIANQLMEQARELQTRSLKTERKP